MRTKLKIQEFLKKVLCILMLVVLLTPNLEVNASVDQEEAGAAIASFSIDFYNKYGNRVTYYADEGYETTRAMAYNEETVGSMQEYKMDCVGWVSYAVHHATGLDSPSIRSGACGFVVPTKYNTPPQFFEDVTGQELKPGDILASSTHVMIYVGDNKIIHCGAGLQYDTLNQDQYEKVYRISESATAGINEEDLAPIISGLNSSNAKKKKDYGYRGLPTKGEYTGSQGTLSLLKYIINVLSQIADYLIGLITLGIKIELIGWTTIIENIITDAVNEITGTELPEAEEPETDGTNSNPSGTTSETDTDSNPEESSEDENNEDNLYTPDATETVIGSFTDKNDRLTVEKIIYNQVPIFDVNIFNIEEAGGQKLSPDGTLAIIKRNIAKWYYVFRNVAIIGLLIVLLYIGIRMTISTAVAEKAVYKRYLKDWVLSFVIVFFIHYIMIFILNVNEYLVDLMKNSSVNNEHFLYETVRTKAYELKFTSGLTGTIMYMVLVYLMVKYLFIYMKRYLTINILAIIAPIIGISYSIDKIKDNKSQSLMAWLQDFTFTTLLQSIHAIIYTMFIPIALEASEENIAGIVFAFILLNFMAKADKIVTNIFGMTKGKALSNILKGDTQKNIMAKIIAVKSVGKFYSTGLRYTGKAIKGVGTTIGEIGGVVLPQNVRYGFNNWYNTTADNILGENNFLDKRRTSDIQTVSGIDQKIKEVKRAYRKEAIKQIKAPFKFAKTGVKFAAGAMVAIPTLIIDPTKGISKTVKIIGYREILKKGSKKYSTPKSAHGLNHMIVEQTKEQISEKETSRGAKDSSGKGKAGNSQDKRAKDKQPKKTRLRTALDKKKNEVKSLQTKYAKSISMLEQAKTLEEDIITRYSGLRQSVASSLTSGANTSTAAARMPEVLIAKMNKQYDKVIEELFKEVEQEDIEDAVDKFLKKGKKSKAEVSDIDDIIKLLQERLDKDKDNNIQISKKDLKKNIDRVISSNIHTKLSKGIDSELKKHDITWEEADKDKQKDIAKDMEAALAKTSDVTKLLKLLDKSFADHGITTAISENAKKAIIQNLSRRMKAEEDKTYTSKELVGILKKGLKKKGSIKKQKPPAEFEDIIKDIESLNELNDNYEKEFGQKIFTKEELIAAMKKTKEAKKFDLYESIISG